MRQLERATVLDTGGTVRPLGSRLIWDSTSLGAINAGGGRAVREDLQSVAELPVDLI